jgi:NADH dehydrogenase
MENKRILVIGGTGYIGRVLVNGLNNEGYQVTVLSRNPKKAKVERGVEYVEGNILNKEGLLQNVKNYDIVIYLAAVVRTLIKIKYKENVIGLKNTLEAMCINKIRRILYFSTQNVYLNKTGPYGDSKKTCERILRNTSLEYIIIRPNYVYGIDRYNDFYKLYKIIKIARICPIIGNGKTKMQPINKNDLAKIALKSIKEWKSKEEINASGKTAITLIQIRNIIKEKMHIFFLTFYIPLWFFRLCKWIIPFDIDGYTEDRIPPEGTNVQRGISAIEEDIGEIVKLDSA